VFWLGLVTLSISRACFMVNALECETFIIPLNQTHVLKQTNKNRRTNSSGYTSFFFTKLFFIFIFN